MSWERWESGELGGLERCVSGVGWQWWESGVSGVRWQSGKGGRILRWHGQRGGNVLRLQFGKGGRVVSREGGMEFVWLQGSEL